MAELDKPCYSVKVCKVASDILITPVSNANAKEPMQLADAKYVARKRPSLRPIVGSDLNKPTSWYSGAAAQDLW